MLRNRASSLVIEEQQAPCGVLASNFLLLLSDTDHPGVEVSLGIHTPELALRPGVTAGKSRSFLFQKGLKKGF